MALPVRQQFIYWAAFCAVFLLLLWGLGQVLLPFIVGGAIAYILDPLADRLEARGFSRIWATVVIFALAILVAVLALVLVLPMLVSQIIALVQAAPELYDTARAQIVERFPSVINEDSAARQMIADILASARAQAGNVASSILTSAGSALSGIVVLVISPVVSFYLLLDWDRMIARIDDLLPRDHAPVIRHLAAQMDATLASFVRGQGTVCLILGTFYAIALMAVGLQFGLVVGLLAGLISFIPYIGALFGGVLAIGLALFQFWGEWYWIAAVAGVFMIGQVVEGNILTPNLVGGSVGLHPVWLLFALAAFGSVFGFVGMLIAVPVAAIIGVLVRYLSDQYRQGLLYKGLAGQTEDDDI
jgi:predicted PurR-regulated permease PerM